MKKLLKWLQWLDKNFLHFVLILFIFLAPLVPKIPVFRVEYTYIKIRYDDFIVVVLYAVFFLQLLRRKVLFNKKFVWHFVAFWAAVFLSFVVGYYIQNTIVIQKLGLLHSLRRVQYMLVFFVGSSMVVSQESFRKYLKYYFLALFLVGLYGIGQKFIGLPSFQSMNPAYSDGRLLVLNPEDRINSTFGGHFDLAAYITFSIPLVLGYLLSNIGSYFVYFGLYIVSLITLLYTAARSSFIGYFITLTSFLLYMKKFKFYLLAVVITVALFFATGEMAKRFQQTFQQKTVFVNLQTGQVNISQKITTKELPSGNYKIPFTSSKKTNVSEEELEKVAMQQALEEARRSGRQLNIFEVKKRADELSKFIRPQKTLLCDIACATRLQVEWPRAIAAFLYNPVFGTGPSSITEATDNDFLRWLGETGLLGSVTFLFLIFSIIKFVWKEAKKNEENKYVLFGFVFGTIALLINALYVDAFEASKVAYNFWLIAGIFVSFITNRYEKKER